MDFARKQLEKYGWTDGEGLGKHGNGITEPIKPKLKRSTTGVGYDVAADFTEHWWNTLYNKAASNLEVENKNGKTKRIRRKSDEEFVITNNSWKLNRKRKDINSEEEYSEFFVRTEVLADGGSKALKVKESDSESEEENDAKNVKILTDKELFVACQGRTAHKGARHGLRALGKLARIEQQEKILLQQEKYNGYSTSKNFKDVHIKNVEEANVNCYKDVDMVKKKKKKKKYIFNVPECESKSNDKLKEKSQDSVATNISDESNYIKSEPETIHVNVNNMGYLESIQIKKSKKKKKKCVEASEILLI